MKNLFYIVIFCLANSALLASTPGRLVFSGIEGSVNSEISMQVLERAYRQLGIAVVYKPLPGERSLQTSNSGEVDGEVFRIANMGKKYTNLIQIPTSINSLEGTAFSKDKNLKLDGWQSLNGRRFGIQVGIKFAERGTHGMKRTMVGTNEQLFRMLASERIDIAVVALTNGLKTLSELKLSGIYPVRPSLQTFPLYHYLNSKHAALVPQLDAVLQKMQQSGEIKQIRDDYLKQMMAQ